MWCFLCSTGKEFVKFVNLLMNDTTFLLDESLDALKVRPEKERERDREREREREREVTLINCIFVISASMRYRRRWSEARGRSRAGNSSRADSGYWLLMKGSAGVWGKGLGGAGLGYTLKEGT